MRLGGLDMALNKCKLGEHIELCNEVNSDLSFGLDSVRGVNNLKFLMPTKADMNGRDLSKFQIVHPGEFVFNHRTSRNGSKFSIAYNDEKQPIICTEDYVVFRIKKESENILVATWLYMFFNRSEFDRYVITNSWGSSTEFYNWEDICAVELELPSFQVQQKYVAIYKAMVTNQQSYERGLEDLKIVFTGYIENLRKCEKLHKIGEYIVPYNEKNTDEAIILEQGINVEKKFITPQRSNSNLQGRKIVRHGQFAYCTQLNNSNVAIAYRDGDDCVVSSVYDVFEITRKEELLPEYLFVWLIRQEFGRYVYWASEGSAYEFLNYNNLANYMIPIPDIKVQQAIADIYNVYNTRKRINEQLKAQIKDICPILIRGSLKNDKR